MDSFGLSQSQDPNRWSRSSLATSFNAGANKERQEKQFGAWHQKQGLLAPPDYTRFANQPVPFAAVPENPNVPTAATPYLEQLSLQRPKPLPEEGAEEPPIERPRKVGMRRTASNSPPHGAGKWPKSTFGTRPTTRSRSRGGNGLHGMTEEDLPPVASIYDSHSNALALPAPGDVNAADSEVHPVQVRVANYPQDMFPELISEMRKHFGPILEAYSGLPDDDLFSDPDIIPRELLSAHFMQLVQPKTGFLDDTIPWVRITFADRECADHAIAMSREGEFKIGANYIEIVPWQEPTDLPDEMEVDTGSPVRRMTGSITGLGVVPSSRAWSSTTAVNEEGGNNRVTSEFLPGARLIQPIPVEFVRNDRSWFSALLPAPQATTVGSQAWYLRLWAAIIYLLDELLGLKHL